MTEKDQRRFWDFVEGGDIDERFGRIAVEQKLLTEEQLQDCMREREAKKKKGISERLSRIVLRRGILTNDDVARVHRLLEKPELFMGRYELQDMLGKGGFAKVYRAFDRELGRDVAIKILKEGAAHIEAFRKRFQREARAIAQLQHPNVVAVHDVGESEDRMYLVMELIDGEAYLRQDGDLTMRLEQLARVARGVGAAHNQKIIHRDLKPANILVDAEGQPKVADFGLAAVHKMTPTMTSSSMNMGTPQYMSPEQVRGERNRIGPATDVYALGAILYEVISGRTPHRGRSAMELFRKIDAEDPEPLPSGTPNELVRMTRKALSKNPEDRYRDGHAFAEEIERYLKGDPVDAIRDSMFYRFRKGVVKRRSGILMTFMMVLLLGSAVALYFVDRERRAQGDRTLKLHGYMHDAEMLRREGLVEPSLKRLDEGIGFARGVGGNAGRHYLALFLHERGDEEKALEVLKETPGEESTRRLRGIIGAAYYWKMAGTYGSTIADDRALEAIRKRAIRDLSVGAPSSFESAERLSLEGKWKEVRRRLEELLAIDPLHTRARCRLARLLVGADEKEEALRHVLLALERDRGSAEAARLRDELK